MGWGRGDRLETAGAGVASPWPDHTPTTRKNPPKLVDSLFVDMDAHGNVCMY